MMMTEEQENSYRNTKCAKYQYGVVANNSSEMVDDDNKQSEAVHFKYFQE